MMKKMLTIMEHILRIPMKSLAVRKYLSGFLLGLFIVIGYSQVCFPADPGLMSAETVTGRITTQNGFLWRYGYDIELRENEVVVNVAVNLITAGGVTKPEIDRVVPAWEESIERIWNRKYSLVTPEGKHYPIVIDVTFKGTRFHHDVIVRPSSRRADELNWHIMDKPETIAHEFGHMIGVFDEYSGGAVSLSDAVIDNTSIMAGSMARGRTYDRHYEQFRKWFEQKTGLDNILLINNDDVYSGILK